MLTLQSNISHIFLLHWLTRPVSWPGLSATDHGKLDNTTFVKITVQSQHTFHISTVIAVNFSSAE